MNNEFFKAVTRIIASAVASTGLVQGQTFEVLDHCDAKSFPVIDGDGRHLIAGTNGDRIEGTDEIIGDWYFAQIIHGDVGKVDPTPFSWESHEITNKTAVGLYAHHLSREPVLYCKLPSQWQMPKDRFECFITGRDEVCFSCQIENEIRYVRWKIGMEPVFEPESELIPQLSQIPQEMRDRSFRRGIRNSIWEASVKDASTTRLQFAKLTNGNVLCVSRQTEVLGEFSSDASDWVWKWSVADVAAQSEQRFNKLIIPRLIPPIASFPVVIENRSMTNDKDLAHAQVLIIESGHAKSLLNLPGHVGLIKLDVSPSREFFLLQYTSYDKPLNYQGRTLLMRSDGTIVSELQTTGSFIGVMDTGQVVGTEGGYIVVTDVGNLSLKNAGMKFQVISD